jgi:hypothetical protein
MCYKRSIKSNTYCIGDLKHNAIFVDRELIPNKDNSIDPDELFSGTTVYPVAIETIGGKDVFSETNIIGIASHKFVSRYYSEIEKKGFIVFNNKYYKILQTRVAGEENKWLEFLCVERGDISKKVNKA